MTQPTQVAIRELIGWDIDESIYRPAPDFAKIESAREVIARRESVPLGDPRVEITSDFLESGFREQTSRSDLQAEMSGLVWTMGVVDLTQLIAFQRRLVFDERYRRADVPSSDAWPELLAMTFGSPNSTAYRTLSASNSELLLQSENPNFQVQFGEGEESLSIRLAGGSPFFEVGEFKGRWFLRDGYHRAYDLMRTGVICCPAVIVHAKTLAELGPGASWFFPEETLFSSKPPLVSDFLCDDLTYDYVRPRLVKTLRLTLTETIEPALPSIPTGEQA